MLHCKSDNVFGIPFADAVNGAKLFKACRKDVLQGFKALHQSLCLGRTYSADIFQSGGSHCLLSLFIHSRESKAMHFLLDSVNKAVKALLLGKSILVQGVIDCLIEDESGKLHLVDYKTDYVENIEELSEKYKIQLDCYANAIEEITGIKVKEKIIYSVHLSESIKIGD